ncbi:efflux RND transporter periplasmic adaptor subunit [Dokdonella soli]|uniref:efflux RND transporter periplasmic adaptor subunit n=1 Tax=Dokdonella soli TaxID=529810 RepID=UPI0031E21BC0
MAAVACITLLALATAGCQNTTAEPSKAVPVRPVVAQTVSAGDRALVERYSGEVHARYEAPIAFRIDGKITRRDVGIGDHVKAGQLLATLDPSDATMNAAGARAAVAAATSQRDVARLQRDRIASLRQRALVSQSQLDQAEDALKAAEAALQQARQQLGVRENQVRYASLTAEHDGVITTQDAEAGQVVAAGQRVFGLAWSDEREVYIAVPESRVAALRANADMKVTLWAQPGRRYDGRLRELSAAADPQSRTFLAKVTIVDAGPDVQLQMSADVAATSTATAGTFTLPASALFHRDAQPAVWVVDEHSRLALRDVVVARYVDDGVAIGSGLSPGERVVTRGVHTLHAGDAVRIVDLPFQPNEVAAR